MPSQSPIFNELITEEWCTSVPQISRWALFSFRNQKVFFPSRQFTLPRLNILVWPFFIKGVFKELYFDPAPLPTNFDACNLHTCTRACAHSQIKSERGAREAVDKTMAIQSYLYILSVVFWAKKQRKQKRSEESWLYQATSMFFSARSIFYNSLPFYESYIHTFKKNSNSSFFI